MKNENEYTDTNGVRYIAADAARLLIDDSPACRGCAFWPADPFENCKIAKCCAEQRSDQRDIIWVRA